MNAKISVFVICVEVIIFLSLYNLHDWSEWSETHFENLAAFAARFLKRV